MLWILITILASLSQTLRSVSQKNIINEVGVINSAYSRFIFALPFSFLLLIFFIPYNDPIFLESTKPSTLSWLFLASICQILFTVLLIKLFTLRSFAIGIAFSKTEVIQTTILEILILGFILTTQLFVAILIGFVGVLFISKLKLFSSLTEKKILTKQVIIGVFCGIFLGLSSVLYKASLDNISGVFLYKKVITLSCFALFLQTIVMGSYIFFFSKENLIKLIYIWKKGLPVGFFGCSATFFWFYAFSLTDATYVRAVGQLEIVFSVAISYLFYKEKITIIELFGIVFIFISILALIQYPS